MEESASIGTSAVVLPEHGDEDHDDATGDKDGEEPGQVDGRNGKVLLGGEGRERGAAEAEVPVPQPPALPVGELHLPEPESRPGRSLCSGCGGRGSADSYLGRGA